MACYVDKVVATANGEIGYKETPKGSNKNKYAKYIDKNYPNFYNGVKDGYAAWCDVFADYCVLVNCSGEKEAEYVLCQPAKSCGAGCSFSYDYYKSKGCVGNEPRLGAQIFFGTGKKPSHTGIVVEVRSDSVVTVEGNSDNMVKRHTYKKNASRIFGYGYPRYNEESKEDPKESAGDISVSTTYRVHTNSGCILRLREMPNTSCAKVASIENGSLIEVSEVVKGESVSGNTEWAKTTYKGKTGYCSMKYLVKE